MDLEEGARRRGKWVMEMVMRERQNGEVENEVGSVKRGFDEGGYGRWAGLDLEGTSKKQDRQRRGSGREH